MAKYPRPEPEYEHGTVARVRDDDGKEFNALMDEYGFWIAVDGSYQSGSVEVLRVIAHPDGSTPGESVVTDNVTRVEVIDDTGRAYANWDAKDVEVSVHDGGNGLKVHTSGIGYAPSYPAADSSVDALIEGMVPRVARAFQRGDHCRNCDWESEDEKWRAMYERVARRTIREAYEEATK